MGDRVRSGDCAGGEEMHYEENLDYDAAPCDYDDEEGEDYGLAHCFIELGDF